uniref:Protein kinase domain-containing protein n=1 Tax=Bionectria ochroleuca TaxID=29856 RepID=A0A8H7K8Z4_BIOOC
MSTPTSSSPVEEETVPTYEPQRFYPAKLGEVFDSRYTVVSKLGFGTNSTIWLCRDSKSQEYVAVKVCALRQKFRDSEARTQAESEQAVAAFFNSIQIEHPGINSLRLLRSHFEVQGPHGTHPCLVHTPLGMNLLQLHLSPNNILISVPDTNIFSQIDKAESEHPTILKTTRGRTIYGSRPLPITQGIPVICDFGESRMGQPGQKYRGGMMPDFYRAPEVILGMEWDEKIDIWCVGLMIWDLFQGTRLFYALKDRILNDEQHLAEMVSLMGPPPKAFLERSPKCREYWDADGNWIASTPIPEQSFDMREAQLKGEDHHLLLALVKKIFRWLPEERATAQDLTEDAFLTQFLKKN